MGSKGGLVYLGSVVLTTPGEAEKDGSDFSLNNPCCFLFESGMCFGSKSFGPASGKAGRQYALACSFGTSQASPAHGTEQKKGKKGGKWMQANHGWGTGKS